MKQLLGIIFLAILCLALFVIGYGWQDIRQGKAPSLSQPGSQTLTHVTFNISPSELFRENYARIASDYVGNVTRKDLTYAAMSGAFASVGDPHTVFLDPKMAKDFASETQGNFVGIGCRLTPDPLGAKVVRVFDGPASRAGVQAGDIIVGVDGEVVSGTPVDDIVSKIRGEEGTMVRITVLRGEEELNMSIRRAQIVMPTVQHEVLPGDIGFIEILQFAQPTARQFDQALESLQAQGVKGLVIDVRNNPGGLLETAIVMLSRFVDRDVVVKMEERGSTETARTQGGRVTVRDLPVVILMNEESASASEIFAGVMRHYNKATLVGEHTYGKASVQQLFSLRDGSSAKITIARYLLPDGTDISRVVDEEGEYVSGGVHPDLEVKPNEDVPREFGKPETDPQLQAAVEVLLGVRQVPAAATSASPRSR